MTGGIVLKSDLEEIARQAAQVLEQSDWQQLSHDKRKLVDMLVKAGLLTPTLNGFVGKMIEPTLPTSE